MMKRGRNVRRKAPYKPAARRPKAWRGSSSVAAPAVPDERVPRAVVSGRAGSCDQRRHADVAAAAARQVCLWQAGLVQHPAPYVVALVGYLEGVLGWAKARLGAEGEAAPPDSGGEAR